MLVNVSLIIKVLCYGVGVLGYNFILVEKQNVIQDRRES